MNLDKLKNDWESLAEQDALGSILTDASKADRGWDIAEFMETGEVEIETVMRHLAELDRLPRFDGAALDFGCGVGRLTQAMARRFAACTGIDISEEMVRNAETHNRYAHCRYVANSGEQLPFADASFSFLYSNIVLQHMPWQFAVKYLEEFVRVLAPRGVMVFGVQDSFVTPDLSSRMKRAWQILRPRSRINDALGVGKRNMQMHCVPEDVVRRALGAARVVDVQFTNTAAKDFNGKLAYLPQGPVSGFVGKQYCAVKE